VKEAYLAQFLKFRREEMVDNGRFVLVLNGRKDEDVASIDSHYVCEKLGEAIADLEGFLCTHSFKTWI